jgi:hypothetical protein
VPKHSTERSMSYNLFLDNENTPKDIWNTSKTPEYAVYNWITVTDYNFFIQTIIDKGLPSRISISHNLSDEHSEYNDVNIIPYDTFKNKTGYDCIVWLIEYCIDYNLTFPKCKVHSGKGIGRKNIEDLVYKFEKYQKTTSSSKKNK